MSDPQVLHGLQAIDQIMQKPEFSLLSKRYNVLYQSLIPNYKLTVKILRRHFTIADQVEQYILTGDSRRLCCQRVMNVLLVHLDIVKDHHQFCDWLDSVSVMGSLIDKIETEFSATDKWGHKMSAQSEHQRSSSTTHQHYTQHANVKSSDGVDQQDDGVMDNVIISCTVGDEEALVDNGCSCSGRRRRLVRYQVLVTTNQSKQTDTALEINVKQRKIDHIKSLLNFKCLLNPSEWSIVNTCLPVLCESLPDDYRSTIEKLKTLPQFLAVEQQLNSLIPTTLTDVKLINEKIITFIVITLSFSSSSGGMTKLCDIMDELVESTSCVQETQSITSKGTDSIEVAIPPVSTKFTPQVEMEPTPETCNQPELTSATMSANIPTCSTVNIIDVVTSNDVTVSSSDMVEEITGEEVSIPQILSVNEDFSKLKSHYRTILQLMPDDYEQSVGKLQSSFSDDQICDILTCTSNWQAANNKILNYLIEKLSCKEDLLDFCDQLEKIATSDALMVIIKDLKTGVVKSLQFPSTSQIPNANSLLSLLPTSQQHSSLDPLGTNGQIFQLAFSQLSLNPNSKVVAVLKKNFVGLCRCLPRDHRVTIRGLKRSGTLGDQLQNDLDLLPSIEGRNGMIITIMIRPLRDDMQVLSFCDVLEDVVDSKTSKKFVQNLRSELIEALSMNDTLLGSDQSSNVFANDGISAVDDECTLFFDQFIVKQMLVINPNSKALAVLRKKFSKLCHCLPDDYEQTINRIKKTSVVPEGLVYQLALLPTAELANCTILAAMIKPLVEETHLVGFCELVKNLVDSTESKTFIETLRNEMIEVLNMDRTQTVLCLPSSDSEYSDDLCTSFFDQAIARNMVAIDKNNKVFAVLRTNFTKLCHCLPRDYKQTIKRIKRNAVVREGLVPQLETLPTTELVNCHILAGMIAPIKMEAHLVGFCDLVKDLVDSDESKAFIDSFKVELIKAMTIDNSRSLGHSLLCLPSLSKGTPGASSKGTSDDLCTSFFDQAVVHNMVSIDSSSKGLAVLRRNFTKLCHCLPKDFKQTIKRIERTSFVPDDTVYQLSKSPSFELANCQILGAMIRPLEKETDLIRFCDLVEDLVNDKEFIESLRNELIEVLSGPSEMTVAMTANTIQPRAMVSGVSSDITIMSTGGGQLISNVPVIDVPVLTETMCTQPSTFDEELLELPCSTGPLPTTMVATTSTVTTATANTNFPTSQSATDVNITDNPIEETSDANAPLSIETATDIPQ
ncbi:uncharacterized protein [Dysidea avara]